MKRICFVVVMFAFAGAWVCAEPLATGERKPPLWAVYYAWYDMDAIKVKGKYNLWQYEPSTNAPPKPRSSAVPLVGYYDSRDKAIARWHIQCARAGGIDAFLVSWWGSRSVAGVSLEEAILPLAAEEKFQVAICCELVQFSGDRKKLSHELGMTLKRLMVSPAYLRVEGKPVVYLYQVPFDPKLSLEDFQVLRSGVEVETGPVYWLMDKVSNVNNKMDIPGDWLAINEISMFGFYGTFSIKREWTYERLMPDYRRVVNAAHGAGKKVCLPVHPGHDNSGSRPDDNFVMPRDDGETLKGYLRMATDAGADVIMLTSFNEWPETTVVEPSSSWADPYQYLKILAAWKGVPFVAPALPYGSQQGK